MISYFAELPSNLARARAVPRAPGADRILPRRYTRCISATLLLVAFAGPALAEEADAADAGEDRGVKILTGAGLQATDNLFATSTGQVSDVIATGTLGLSMKAALSRQSLALDAMVIANEYQAHQDWNYVGTNISAGWQWSSGTGLHGAVTGSHVKAQNPVYASAGSTQRNLNTTQNSLVSVGYELSGGWDFNTGLVYSSSQNESAVVGQSSFQYNGVYVGATYNFRSGNALTLTLQNATGNNLYEYKVRSSELKYTSKSTDVVTVGWQLLYWNQSYPLHPEYDFAVLGGGVLANWPVTSKTAVGLAVQRQPYGNPTTNSVYSILDSVAITPTWEVTPKVVVRGLVRNGLIRDYGDPGGGESGRVDRIQTQSLGVYWAWREYSVLSVRAERTTRTSTVANGDFIVNQLFLAATYTF